MITFIIPIIGFGLTVLTGIVFKVMRVPDRIEFGLMVCLSFIISIMTSVVLLIGQAIESNRERRKRNLALKNQ